MENELSDIGKRDMQEVNAKIPTFNDLIFALRKYLEDGIISPLWVEVYKWYQKDPLWKEKSQYHISRF